MTGETRRVGVYGFGAAAHIVTQIARHRGREIYAFVRPGDEAAKALAVECGARWAGDSGDRPPEPLDAAIIFAPVGSLIPIALRDVAKGGVVVCGGIHMSDVPSFRYELLWGERQLRSVANLTRKDGDALFAAVEEAGVRSTVRTFPLEAANEALDALRSGAIAGAAVLLVRTGDAGAR
jgi:propanol-preferring alcohol dehydrogenase